MEIRLKGFGPHSQFTGAEVIEESDLHCVVLATILEPQLRADDAGEHNWNWHRETAWRAAVIRRARRIVRGNPHTVWVQFDPGRDRAESVLL